MQLSKSMISKGNVTLSKKFKILGFLETKKVACTLWILNWHSECNFRERCFRYRVPKTIDLSSFSGNVDPKTCFETGFVKVLDSIPAGAVDQFAFQR